MKKYFLTIALVLFVATSLVFSQIPRVLNYQASLRDQNDRPFNGQTAITFAIYEQEFGGTPIWSENQLVDVVNGFMNVYLGKENPLNINFNKPLWLQITIGGNSFPRTPLTSTPYAMKSLTSTTSDTALIALTVVDGAITQEKLAPGVQAIPWGPAGGDLQGNYPNPTLNPSAVVRNIPPGSITQDKLAPNVSFPPSGPASGDLTGTYPDPLIAPGAVKTDRIFNGAVTTPKLADGAVTTPKIADGAVTNSKIGPDAVTTDKIMDGEVHLVDLNQDVIDYFINVGDAAGGDLFGTYPNPNVGGWRGIPLSTVVPSDGQVYIYDETNNQWTPSYLNGDVVGPINNNTVTKWLNVPLFSAPSNDGEVYAYSEITNDWRPVYAQGDVTGPYNSLTVGALLNVPLAMPPTNVGDIYWFNGSQWVPGQIQTVGPIVGFGYNDGVTVAPLKIRDDAAFLPDGSGSVLWFNGTPGTGQWVANKITDQNVAANAAIAGTKIVPNFGNQNIITTGNLNANAATFTGNVTAQDIFARHGTFTGNLSVNGTSTLTGIVTTGSDLVVSGTISNPGPTVTINDNLQVNGAITATGGLTAASGTFTGNVTAGGNVNALDFIGRDFSGRNGTFTGNVSVTGLIYAPGTTVTIDDNLQVNGNINATGSLNVGTITGTNATFQTVTANTFNGGNFIGNNGTFSGNVNVTGNLTANNGIFNNNVSAVSFTQNGFAVLDANSNFAAAATSDATVAGKYNSFDIQLKNGVVGTPEIANAAVTTAKIAPSGTNNQFLVTNNLGNTTWATFSKSGKFTGDGIGTPLDIAAGAITTTEILDGTITTADISNGTILPEDVNLGAAGWNFATLQQGGSNVLTTATSFSNAAGSDATVSGQYNSLNIQINPGVVGSTEIADNSIVDADISPTAGIAGTKVVPNFGAQNIITTGNVNANNGKFTGNVEVTGNLTVGGTIQGAMQGVLSDGAGIATFTYDGSANATVAVNVDGSTIGIDGSDALYLLNNAVTTPKIANGAVTTAKIAPSGTNNQFLVTNNLGNTTWATFNKTSKFTGDGIGTPLDIAAGAITTTEILDETITTADISDGTILPADVNLGAAGWNFTTLKQGGYDVLTTATSFSNAAGSDATVSGQYNSLDIQIKAGVVGSTEIADNSIVDADISPTAGIAGTKVVPNFGAQNIITTGNVNANNGTFSGNVGVTGNLTVGGTITGQLVNALTNGDNTIVAFTYNNTAPATVAVNQGANFNWTGNHSWLQLVTFNNGLTVNGTAQFNDIVVLGSSSADQITFNGTLQNTIIPAAGVDLGSSANRFDDLFVNHIDVSGYISNGVGGGAPVYVDDHLLPNVDVTYNLGSNTLRWNHLYVSGSSIHIGSSVEDALVGYNAANDQVTIDKGLSVGSNTQPYKLSVANDGTAPAVDVTGFIQTNGTNSYIIANGSNSFIQSTDGTSNATIDGPGGYISLYDGVGNYQLLMDASDHSFKFYDYNAGFYGRIVAPTFTANQTWTFPDTTGTVALLEANQTWTGTQTFNNVVITGGTIDGVTIGGTTPGNGTFNNLTVNDNTTLGNDATTDNLTVTAASTFTGNVNINNSGVAYTTTIQNNGTNPTLKVIGSTNATSPGQAYALDVNGDVRIGAGGTFNNDNPNGRDLYVQNNFEVDDNAYIGDGTATDVFNVNATSTMAQVAAANPALTVNGLASSTVPAVRIYNTSTNSGAGALELRAQANLDDHLLQVRISNAGYTNAGAAVFTGFTSNPNRALVAISNDGTSNALEVNNMNTNGLAAYFENTQNAVKPAVQIKNNSSLTGGGALELVTDDNLDDHLLQVRITNNAFNNAGAATFSGYTSAGGRALVAVENEGTSPALSVTNTYTPSVNPASQALALNIQDGATKYSYTTHDLNTSTTLPNGYSVIYLTNTSGSDQTVTMPTGYDGMFLYVIYVSSSNHKATFPGVNPDGTDYQTQDGKANLLFMYANGAWRVVSYVE